MSERLTPNFNSGEKLSVPEASKNLENAQERAKAAHEFTGSEIETIRHQIEDRAISGREVTVGEKQQSPSSHTFGTHKQLKTLSYKRALSSIQGRLKGPEKAFSKTIHKPVVEHASEIGAKTIARPSGILGGGLTAFIGSVILLVISRRYGFAYNFSVFLILLVCGYLVGSLAEIAYRTLRRSRG